jgi:hypothetical protein
VADFGAVICDRNGMVHAQCAVLVQGVFGNDPLFYSKNAGEQWAQSSVLRRTEKYTGMLDSGARMLASVSAINKWLAKAAGKYSPELFAYNLAFDVAKCANTAIDLTLFPNRFCLWHAAAGNICGTKAYKKFILDNHLFNNPTEKGNMTFRTDAEAVTGFLNDKMQDEPHTSLEDLIGFEVPVLKHILTKRNWREKMTPYAWKQFQVKDHFEAK